MAVVLSSLLGMGDNKIYTVESSGLLHNIRNFGMRQIRRHPSIRDFKKILLLLAIITIALFSCEGKVSEEEKMFDLIPQKGDVYVAGYETNEHGKNVALLWKNGVAHYLSNGNFNAYANSVYVAGNDVYLAGSIENEQHREVAILWKNGVAQNLTDGTQNAKANSVFVWGNDIYVAGYEYSRQPNQLGSYVSVAILWKNGIAQNLTDGTCFANATSVYISQNNVYVAGNEELYDAEGGYALLWKNGVAQTLPGGRSSFSVFVSGNDVFVAGKEQWGAVELPMLWKNGEVQDLTDDSHMGEANSVFVSGNDVYVAGCEEEHGILWKNGILQNMENEEIACAYSVYVSGSDVYVVGVQNLSVATLWKNGIAQNLSNGTRDAGAFSVFVVE